MYTKTEKWTEKQMSINEFMETIRKICDEGKGHYRAVLEHTNSDPQYLIMWPCAAGHMSIHAHFDPEEEKLCLISDILDNAEYKMNKFDSEWHPETPLWAETMFAVVGVDIKGDRCVIKTKEMEKEV